MKVFISWSNDQSNALAKALHEWLPLILHYVEPWLSNSDINAGERWSPKVAEELAATNFGIICITKDNVVAPWLLFEAGALAKSMEDGKVIPLLLDVDVKEISGPLAQFQAKKVEKSDILDVITAINKSAAAPVPDTRLQSLFNSLWPELEKKISSIPKKSTPLKQARPQNDILEELVSGVRGLELRLRDNLEESKFTVKRRRNRMHPGMLMEMARHISSDGRDPIQILFAVSLLRDDAPWLYELGMETYRALKSSDYDEASKAHYKLSRAIEVMRHGSSEDFIDKNSFMIVREVLSMIEYSLSDLDPKMRRTEPKAKKVRIAEENLSVLD
jgi:hypothetical protein